MCTCTGKLSARPSSLGFDAVKMLSGARYSEDKVARLCAVLASLKCGFRT